MKRPNSLRSARLAIPGMTLRKVEKLTGISNACVSQMETGWIKHPNLILLFKLSKVYNIRMKTVMLWVYPELRGEI